jgi:hypothetical protein
MRTLLWIVLLMPLAACSPPDLAVSAISGRSCSVVNLDQGQSYCQALDPPTRPMPYCTHSLGDGGDCWAEPEKLPTGTNFLGDTPPPTSAQFHQMQEGWLPRKLGM